MSDTVGDGTTLPEAVREILRQAERFDGTPPVSDQALLALAQGRRSLFGFDAAGDSTEFGAAESAAGATGAEVAAVGIIGEGELDLVVRPASRGRGIARAALRELLSGEPRSDEPRSDEDRRASPPLRAWAHGENPAARALLQRAGFAPVRSLLRMTLDPGLLDGAIAESRPLPSGFAVRAFDPGAPADAVEWVRVNAAAFADHPEQGALTLADFAALTREPWFDPEDLRLAFRSPSAQFPEPVSANETVLGGFTWVKTTHDVDGAETDLYVLGVDPAHAGIGLGAALLGETLRRMAAHDPRRISLYVDGENENARALYERAGFEIEQRSTQFALLNNG